MKRSSQLVAILATFILALFTVVDFLANKWQVQSDGWDQDAGWMLLIWAIVIAFALARSKE